MTRKQQIADLQAGGEVRGKDKKIMVYIKHKTGNGPLIAHACSGSKQSACLLCPEHLTTPPLFVMTSLFFTYFTYSHVFFSISSSI